jgi:hypothetical protein
MATTQHVTALATTSAAAVEFGVGMRGIDRPHHRHAFLQILELTLHTACSDDE